MSEKRAEAILPVSCEDGDYNPNEVILFGVVFDEDFGPFIKGETYTSLSFDHTIGTLIAFSDSGEKVKGCEVVLMPREEEDTEGRS